MKGSSPKMSRHITHEEARAAAQRFIDWFFRNKAERPRIAVPARPDYDDDCLLMAYIEQQEKREDVWKEPTDVLIAWQDKANEIDRILSDYNISFTGREVRERLDAAGYVISPKPIGAQLFQHLVEGERPKCVHSHVEGAIVDGKRVLRCMRCKLVVHVIPEQPERTRGE